ncbi:ankyrin repeat-containing domain protein [Mycena maculata]|uniref:Ankyrin repeat-containing domain protein n=1 Tax=Mycena maculata TaxID=230809 RepID=A0AAD7J354_9AGAR|nr:ankyrin repeat-containing domain protein [Mycena maculata]
MSGSLDPGDFKRGSKTQDPPHLKSSRPEGSGLEVAVGILNVVIDATTNMPYINIITGCIQQLISLKKAFDDLTDRSITLIETIGEISLILARGLHQLEDSARHKVTKDLSHDLHKYQVMLDDARVIVEKWVSRKLPQRILRLSSFKSLAHGIESRLNRFRDTFSMARLISISIGQDILASHVRAISSSVTRMKLNDWLKPTDVGKSNQEAAKKRTPGTGSWLLQDRVEFSVWKYAPGSALWLYGISGCGKTVLSSAIVAEVRDREAPLAFFYFDTNNSEERTVAQLLSSLIMQLSVQAPHPDRTLEAQWAAHANGQHLPELSRLVELLYRILGEFTDDVYIILDALDESSERDEVLRVIHDVMAQEMEHLHLLLTSRPEVTRVMPALVRRAVPLDMEGCVTQDIESHIDNVLATDLRLSRWTDAWKLKIKSSLLEDANGMFRLVSLQLDQLRRCTHPLRRQQALSTMPTSLFDIYDRILDNIEDPYMLPDVHRVLAWLTYSASPMRLAEIIDAISFDFDASPLRFDPEARMDDTVLIEACAGLISVAEDPKDGVMTVKLAHSSVKEYVLSPERKCKITEETAQYLMASTCVGYLCSFNRALSSDADLKLYPLAEYSSRQWFIHLQKCAPTDSERLTPAVLELLQPHSPQYITLFRMALPGADNISIDWTRSIEETFHPLYVYAFIGHYPAVQALIAKGVEVNAPPRGEHYATALQAASFGGFFNVVTLLLHHNADANAQGGYYHTALQAASFQGSREVVQLLLQHDADINAQGGNDWTALHAASGQGHIEVVRLLLANGADLKAQGGRFWTALHAASTSGSVELVQLLLDEGLDANTEGGSECTALHAASIKGHLAVARLLLEHGADVNRECDKHDNKVDSKFMHWILRIGQRVWQCGGAYGTALQAASFAGSVEVVTLLLEHGADVNAKGGMYGSALQAGSISGSLDVVHLLLEGGADVNALGGFYGTALQAATYRTVELVRLLLDQGADVNAEGGCLWTALQAASSDGNMEIVALLLQRGAYVNIHGGYLGSALQAAATAASSNDALKLVELLIEKGADVNARGGRFGSALNIALQKGRQEIVETLLFHGAEKDENEVTVSDDCVVT